MISRSRYELDTYEFCLLNNEQSNKQKHLHIYLDFPPSRFISRAQFQKFRVSSPDKKVQHWIFSILSCPNLTSLQMWMSGCHYLVHDMDPYK